MLFYQRLLSCFVTTAVKKIVPCIRLDTGDGWKVIPSDMAVRRGGKLVVERYSQTNVVENVVAQVVSKRGALSTNI